MGDLTVRLRECWVREDDLRLSTVHPNGFTEPTVRAIVVEVVFVAEPERRRGVCKRFLNLLCTHTGFDLVIVECVQNEHLAAALERWGWQFDARVMDFYYARTAEVRDKVSKALARHQRGGPRT